MRVILFNLFPYRAQREARKKRQVLAELSVGALLGLFFCYSLHLEFEAREASKQDFLGNLTAMEGEMANRVAQVQAMKDRLAVLNRQVDALQAVERESLLASRWVSYLDGTVPGNVSVNRVLVSDDLMVVNGFTDAVSSLAKWVDQMEAGNSLFASVDLVSVNEPNAGKEGIQADSRHLFEIRAVLRGVRNETR